MSYRKTHCVTVTDDHMLSELLSLFKEYPGIESVMISYADGSWVSYDRDDSSSPEVGHD